MARQSQTRTFLPLVVLALAGIVIGGVWAWVAPRDPQSTPEIEAELRALRESEAKRSPDQATASKPALCRKLDVTNRGAVTSDDLNEISGLVASRRQAGLFWANEDSGAAPQLSALRENGSLAGQWTIPGAENVDWEDIAAGPSPNGPVLYAADTGDNAEGRDSVVVYRVPEPSPATGGGATTPADRLELTYPDGAHDAEAVIVDPRRGTLMIFTKGTPGNVYALSPPLPFGSSARLRLITAAPLSLATGADVSADGTTVALRGYFGFVVWRRKGNEPLTQTVRRKPCATPTILTDGQGEAIALSKGGTTAWTIAEGSRPPVLRYRAAAK